MKINLTLTRSELDRVLVTLTLRAESCDEHADDCADADSCAGDDCDYDHMAQEYTAEAAELRTAAAKLRTAAGTSDNDRRRRNRGPS